MTLSSSSDLLPSADFPQPSSLAPQPSPLAPRPSPLAPQPSPIAPHPSSDYPAFRPDTLADSVVILLVWTAAQRVIGFCRALLFCRWLDPASLGQWDMAFGFLNLAAPVSVLALSGSFGRYVEYYRQRGQLRTLLARTGLAMGLLACLSAIVIASVPQWFSELIFGTPHEIGLARLLAVSLPAVVGFHFFVNLFNALRQVRLITAIQVVNSLAFAAVGILLVLCWRATAASAVLAFGGASAICAAGGVWWLVRRRRLFPAGAAGPSHREMWSKVVPFAASIWITSLLGNLFELADRYMIVHYLPATAEEALAQVGNYHASRMLPLLLVSVAALLSPLITPHLSHDWEAGRRSRVSMRLNLYLKLWAMGMSAGAVAVLLAAPLLFGLVFQGKFSGGLDVLPGALTYCAWLGASMVAQNYLWCAEKARLASLALLAGLCVNVSLSLLLLPSIGLLGAVTAASAAHFVALGLVLGFSRSLGFRTDLGTWIVLAVPILFWLGPWITAAVLIGILAQAITTHRIFSAEEKSHLLQAWLRYRERLRQLRASLRPGASGPGA